MKRQFVTQSQQAVYCTEVWMSISGQVSEYIDPKPGREYMHVIFVQKGRLRGVVISPSVFMNEWIYEWNISMMQDTTTSI